ncbi:ARM repeat-containing protein [Annulohypoxylon maeteangense]|uniref:ARM repeat-containing protein n=1 Tax=Annulohypoxylon maeteangense TaxID=1927788 RepID=UPI0020089E1B|nr:ARM repeat-containing protein [Annulohypoxylon maeteangense]KAI0882137.1 ARM repeat-containing protein [Annulohypoxylon maeteangense]
MDFAIEAPGAAAPFSVDELYRALEAAQSYDNNQRQAATQQLSTWESQAGYYPTLQTIFLNKNLSTQVRLLAIIQLKNGIDRYWRLHKVHNSIPQDARQVVREQLFQGTIGESERQLAQLNALVTAKIIRIDFPSVWPTPLNDLTQILRERKDGNQVELYGALMLLLRIVKELGTARLRKSQTTLQSITPEIVYVLCEIYNAKFTAFTSFLDNGPGDKNSDEALLAMEISLYALKTLRRLLLVGYEFPHNDKNVQDFWSSSLVQFQTLFRFVKDGPPTISRYVDILTKLFMQYTKLHIEMAEQHPASFVLLPISLRLVSFYWSLTSGVATVFNELVGIRHNASSQGKTKNEGPILEKVALKGLLLVRACVQTVYRGKRSIIYRSAEAVQEEQQAIERIKVDLLKDEFIVHISDTIITHFLLFRQADLDAWEEDPQEWEQQEETQGNAYQWEVRPCAEKLFLDLLLHYKRLLLPKVLSYFVAIEDPQTTLVAREAIYTAMGLSSSVIHQEVNFEGLLKNIIVADAQRAEPFCQVLRRRIAILLSQWVPVQSTPETRPLVYKIFCHFLNPNDQYNDIVVRITTARLFKVVCDEMGFDGEIFSPYASDVLVQLINLLGEVEVDEAKLAILESTRTVILRMETHVSHFGDMIMDAIPNIWQSPAGDLGFMMKQSVLAIIQTLVMSMKTESQRYHQMILPLVAEATQEGTELFLYLIEEALELWSNILHQTQPPMSPDLLHLIPTAIKLLGEQNEHTVTLVSILGCYVVLSPETILQDQYRAATVSVLTRSLDSKNREQVNLAVKYFESLIRLSHELGGTAGLEVLIKDMMSTGALPSIFEGIHDSFEAHQTSGPKKKQSRVTGLTLVDYFVILSRIAVLEPKLFVEVLASFGSVDQVWKWLSAEWFLAFDNMADFNQQKLNLLAVTRFLENPQPMLDLALSKLQDYFSMWTSVLVLLLDLESPNPEVDTLVLTSEPEPTVWDTPKDVRERALSASDPVKRVQSLDFIRQTLESLPNRIGAKNFEEWTANVDREILVNFASVSRLPLPTGVA